MKIALLADIQINCSSKTSERIRDTKHVLDNAAKSLIERKPNYIVLAGDIFEHYETTDDERLIYTSFINQLLKIPGVHIIVIDGNHDIRHKNFSMFDGMSNTAKTNVLTALNDAIDNEQYHYSPYAKVYEFGDAVFGCWSELARYCPEYGQMSPWSGQSYEGKAIFDVYHGTIAGAKDMGTGYQPEPDNVSFKAPVALLGHIHMHQVLQSGSTWCIYPSSLLIRNFAEGARYDANGQVYDYNSSHGYCLIEGSNVEFVPIAQPTKYVTIVADAALTTGQVDNILANYANVSVKFKLVIDCPNADVLAYIYNRIDRTQYWHLHKAESITAKFIAPSSVSVTDKLQMNIETFENIANELLVQRNIDDVVKAKTIELLRQECGYHLTADTPKSIKFVGARIYNFKTIDKAEIKLTEHGLTLLSANNGVGKTTVMEAICFALTGMHNASFKKNAKNQQLIRLFNDKQPQNDNVNITVCLQIDSDYYEVTVVLTKNMKAGWTVDNWQSMVASVRKQVLIEIEGDNDDMQMIAEGDDAEQWLVQNFGDFKDFSTLHSINSASLQAIKEMDDDALANFMLQRLGYSVLQRLQFYAGGCKAGAIEKTPKTTNSSVVDLNAKLLDAKQLLKEQTERSVAYNKEIADKDAQCKAQSTIVNDLHAKLYPIDTAKVDEYKVTLQPYEQLISAGKDLSAFLQPLTDAISTATVEQNTKTKLQTEYADALQKLNVERTKHLDAVNAKYDELTANIRKDIDAIIDSITSKQGTLLQMQTNVSNAKNELTKINVDTANNKAKIAELQDRLSKVTASLCPTCGQPINAEEVDKLKSELTSQINAIDSIVSSLLIDEQSVQRRVNDLQQNIDKTNAELLELNNKLAKRKNDLTAIDKSKIEVDTTDLQSAEHIANDIKSKLDACQVQDIAALIARRDKLQAAINAKVQYDAMQSHITSNAAIQSSIDAEQCKQRTLQTEYDALVNAKHIADTTIADTNKEIGSIEQLIKERTAYDITVAAVAQYEWLVKVGLPKYLYNHAVAVVNNYINSLNMPSTICPRLSNDMYGRLTLIDRRNDGQLITRQIQEASGMELALSGLVLCFALHNAKLTVDFPFVMIDEVSGVLNEGNSSDNTNYMQLFTKLLNIAAKDMQLLVIDHRINADDCDTVYELIKQQETNTTILKQL